MLDLKRFRHDFDIPQAEICGILGIAQPYVSSIERGKRPLNQEKVDELYKHYGDKITPYIRERIVVISSSPPEGKSDKTRQNEREDCSEIPLFPVSSEGGALKDFNLEIRNTAVEYMITPTKKADLAITVAGDDMSPEYPSGTKVVIKKIDENAFIQWGKVFVLDTINGVILKRLMPSKDPDVLICESINEKYPPFEVRRQDVNGIYRVLMALSVK